MLTEEEMDIVQQTVPVLQEKEQKLHQPFITECLSNIQS